MSPLDEFKTRLTKEWLIPFCSARGYSHQGFVASSIDKLTAADACDFMQAVDSGLVNHHEGTFTAICSRAKEQIFTQGERSTVPRKVTLWLEPIITIAGLMRLFGITDGRLTDLACSPKNHGLSISLHTQRIKKRNYYSAKLKKLRVKWIS